MSRRVALKVAVWVLCLAPLALLLSRAATGNLSANPISFVTTWLGDWTLRLLLASLAMTALTLMLPLAATSTTAAIKKLGGRNWQRLHRLAYAIGICGVLHYLWLAKKANPDPYYYATGLALLLVIPPGHWGRRRVARLRASATLPSADRTTLATLSPQGRGSREGR